MKTPFFLIPALILLLTTSCGEKQQEYNACFCALTIENESNSDAPVLGFYETYTSAKLGDFLIDVIMDSTNFQLDSIEVAENEYEYVSEFNEIFKINIDGDNRFAQSPEIGYALGRDTSRVNEILAFQIEENWFEVDEIKFVWSKNIENPYDEEGNYYTLYGLKLDGENKPRISSEDVKSARNFIDPESHGDWVSIIMNEEGKDKWAEMTMDNRGDFIAIASKDKVLSAPIVNEPITNGETIISGNLTEKEAKELADLINCVAHKIEVGQAAFEKEVADCLTRD